MAASPWVWIGSFVATATLLGVGATLLRSRWSRRERFAAWWLVAAGALVAVAAAVLGWAGGTAQTVNLLGEYAQEAPFAIDTALAFALVLRTYLPDGDHRTAALYGVVTTLVLRAVFIGAVTVLLRSFTWLLWPIGLLVLYAAVALARRGHPRPAEHGDTPERRLTRAVAGWGRRTRTGGAAYLPPMVLAVVLLTLEDPLAWPDGGPAYPTILANALALLPIPILVRYSDRLLARISYLPSGLGVVGGFLGVKIMLLGLAGNVLPFLNDGEPVAWAPAIPATLSFGVTAGTVGITLAVSRGRHPRRPVRPVADPAAAPRPSSCGSPLPVQGADERRSARTAGLRRAPRPAARGGPHPRRAAPHPRGAAVVAAVVVVTGLVVVAGILACRRRALPSEPV